MDCKTIFTLRSATIKAFIKKNNRKLRETRETKLDASVHFEQDTPIDGKPSISYMYKYKTVT